MSNPSDPTFDVISHDMHGAAVECTYCTRPIKKVVVLPLKPLLTPANNNISGTDDSWIGVCPYCVLAMAKAFQAADENGA